MGEAWRHILASAMAEREHAAALAAAEAGAAAGAGAEAGLGLGQDDVVVLDRLVGVAQQIVAALPAPPPALSPLPESQPKAARR